MRNQLFFALQIAKTSSFKLQVESLEEITSTRRLPAEGETVGSEGLNCHWAQHSLRKHVCCFASSSLLIMLVA